jgi:transposase
VGQAPANFEVDRSRWTLADLLSVCADWLNLTTATGMWRLMRRLKLRYKRGRHYVHSPDPNYADRQAEIQRYGDMVRAEPERYVWLYLDELTFYRQPTLASAYALQGSKEPRARRSHRSNTSARVLAAMNALTGQVTYLQRSRTTLDVLRQFYYQLRATYPTAERIYVAQDNWPVHDHPDIRVILEPQEFPWRPRLPENWPKEPRSTIEPDNLPIQLLFQPTYAPWTNPIEKLWRWLYEKHLHLHWLSDQWDELKQQVTDFLDDFSGASPELLRYVGLLRD